MSYATAGLRLAVPAIGDAPQIFTYTSADARATVEGASFFTDGVPRGMKVGDFVFVNYTTGYLATIHGVASVSGDAATISAAVLA